jgi:hypothetical protein
MNLYLSSYEYNDFAVPRKIIHFQKIILSNKNVLSIEVKEPLIGQKYGLLDTSITKLYLVNRFDEQAFDQLNNFPIDVYVLIMRNIKDIEPVNLQDLQNIAWACLYNNERDAKKHKIR